MSKISIEYRFAKDKDFKRYEEVTPYLFVPKGDSEDDAIPMVAIPYPDGGQDIQLSFRKAEAVLKQEENIRKALSALISFAGGKEDSNGGKIKENRSKDKTQSGKSSDIQAIQKQISQLTEIVGALASQATSKKTTTSNKKKAVEVTVEDEE